MSMTCTSKSSLPTDLGSLVMTVSPAMSVRHAEVCCFEHYTNILAKKILSQLDRRHGLHGVVDRLG
jgi:hypothetical protein